MSKASQHNQALKNNMNAEGTTTSTATSGRRGGKSNAAVATEGKSQTAKNNKNQHQSLDSTVMSESGDCCDQQRGAATSNSDNQQHQHEQSANNSKGSASAASGKKRKIEEISNSGEQDDGLQNAEVNLMSNMEQQQAAGSPQASKRLKMNNGLPMEKSSGSGSVSKTLESKYIKESTWNGKPEEDVLILNHAAVTVPPQSSKSLQDHHEIKDTTDSMNLHEIQEALPVCSTSVEMQPEMMTASQCCVQQPQSPEQLQQEENPATASDNESIAMDCMIPSGDYVPSAPTEEEQHQAPANPEIPEVPQDESLQQDQLPQSPELQEAADLQQMYEPQVQIAPEEANPDVVVPKPDHVVVEAEHQCDTLNLTAPDTGMMQAPQLPEMPMISPEMQPEQAQNAVEPPVAAAAEDQQVPETTDV